AGPPPRYAREWLEQQAAAGYLACDDPKRPAMERRYRLPAGHAEVLLDADSPYHAAPVAGMLASVARVLPQLLESYRTGSGVPYAAYGQQMRRGIAAVNRPMFLHELASIWLPAVPEIDRRLGSGPPGPGPGLSRGPGAPSIAPAPPPPPRASRSWGSTWTRRRSPKPGRRPPRRVLPTASPSWPATPWVSLPRAHSISSPSSRRSTTWPTPWGRSGRPAPCSPTMAVS